VGTHIGVSGLRVSYEGLEILHGIDFEIRSGEFVSIVGKSGSGKSSLLHALAGFIESEGRIHAPTEIGMVFQNYAVFPWLTVQGNIALGLNGLPAQTRAHVIEKSLEMIDLSEEAHKYPFQLSGGQAQRVALARALAPDPEVILMDEPFGALDTFTRDRMQTWLLELWGRSQKTVLFVTHNLDEAVFLSDRIIVLGAGEILGEFPVQFTRPRSERLKFASTFVDLKRCILERMEG
jgi:NitT/TauT family transport system ATP-binding protein